MADDICTVLDCGRKHRARGLCHLHYQRYRTSGALDAQPRVRRAWGAPAPICTIPECDRPQYGRGWCNLHYNRWYRTGDPLKLLPPVRFTGTLPGADSPNWRGDNITYWTAHLRVRNARGSASQHPCVDCGRQAYDWSYDYLDPDEKTSECGPYSVDIDRYWPRCRNCHKRFDTEAEARP